MKLIKCDRCGELLNPKDEVHGVYKANGENYDLCGQCGCKYVGLSETLLMIMIQNPKANIELHIGELENENEANN